MFKLGGSGLLILTLQLGCACSAVMAMDITQHNFWSSGALKNRLPDGSVLTEYYGESTAYTHPDVVFRVGFIPRFGCAPLITIKAAIAPTENRDRAREISDFNRTRVFIDELPVRFPVVIDEDRGKLSVYMNADLQRRITMRLKLDAASKMRVETSAGEAFQFSLLGSAAAMSSAQQHCRQHNPIAQQ
jgi:hypothetical protein